MSPSDAQIMEQVQQGRHDLFEELVRRYRPRLLRVATSKLGDEGLAEDVVQEAFLAVFAARQTYNPRYAVSTWIWTILLNLCRRRWKRRTRKPLVLANSSIETPFFDPVSRADDPHDESHMERRELVAALLSALPDVQADALRLRFYGELTFDEVARTMGCSLSGAKRRVRTGLSALAERLRNDEGEVS